MIGILFKRDQNWFIKYESLKDNSTNEIEVHPDDVLYCLDSDNDTKVLFDIVKIYLYNETLYRAKLVQRIDELELLEKDMSILIDSLENPKPPNEKLKMALKKYKNKIGEEDWDEIYEQYSNENYPPFGGPFTDAIPLIEWLRRYFNPPTRKD
jgi:hypothetical protein